MTRPLVADQSEPPPPTVQSAGYAPYRRWRQALNSSPAWMAGILLGLVVIFSLLRPTTFPTAINLRNVFLDASSLLVVSVGMTYVMIAGGFDLSVGSVLVFSGVIAAQVMAWLGPGLGSILTGCLAALVGGIAWGTVNGICITLLRVPALITTLGSMGAALGIANLITGGNDLGDIPDGLVAFGTTNVAGIPWLVLVSALVTVIGAVWLAMTRFGRYTYLVGSNPEAARRLGIGVGRHLATLYALSGLLAGLAGILSLARFSTTTIEGHSSEPLEAIAAVVLGGTSLFGGRGSILGTVVGVFIPAVLADGFIILGVQPFWQQVVIGCVLVAAVYLDQLKRVARERG